MRARTLTALGAVVGLACAGTASAQVGCATCSTKPLAPAKPNTIPKCNKHDGLTQYPLSEKRYIKQFCHPTICPNSCFGHFKTQWTPWPQACPGWPQDGVSPANFGPNFIPYAAPAEAAAADRGDRQTPTAPAPAEKPADPPAPLSKPLDPPPSKPMDSTAPPVTPPTTPPGVKIPEVPPPGTPKF